MGKVSIQDIETRMAVLEAKIDFTMKAFAVKRMSKTLPPRETVVNLLDVYHEMNREGEEAVYASDVAQARDTIDAIEEARKDDKPIDEVISEAARDHAQRTGDEVV